jgi:hypothetical protein
VSRETFDEFGRASIDFLTTARVPYVVVGGLAVAVIAEPRFTADIGVVAFVSMDAAERLITSATAAGFTSAGDEVDRLRETGTLRFRRSPYQLDIIVASLPSCFSSKSSARETRMCSMRCPSCAVTVVDWTGSTSRQGSTRSATWPSTRAHGKFCIS